MPRPMPRWPMQAHRMLQYMLSLLLATLLGQDAGATNCEPSRACALLRAQQLALDHLMQPAATVPENDGWRDAARLIAAVELAAARTELDPLAVELLERAAQQLHGDAVLAAVALQL